MDHSQDEQILRQADRERGGRPIDLAHLVSAAAAHGSLTWRDVADLAVRDQRSGVGRPPFVLEFVVELVAALAPRSILDPWVTTPTMLAAAHDASGSDRSCGLIRDKQLFEIAQAIASIDWRNGDPLSLLDNLAEERFELLLVAPPLGPLRGHYDLRPDDPPARGTELADLVLWRATRHLASGGHLLFHAADNFLWAQSRRRLCDDLARQGLYLRSVVSVDGGLGPSISASTSLLLFGRDAPPNLFVARLDRRTPIPVLVANLLAARPDDDPQLGSLTTWASFRGWRSFVLEGELADMFGASEMRTLGEVGSVRTVNLRPGQPYEAPPNCAFVPDLGFGPVTTSPPYLEGKRSYRLAEVRLDPVVARAEYVAALLSSPIGKRLRESVARGSTIPHTSGALGTLRIPVPSLAVQEEAIRTATHLASMEAAISRLRSDLWRHPESAERLLVRLENEARADPVRRWIESLPYPLAAVLQRYTAQRDPEQQVEALLHFFEATAQFGCALLCSIIRIVPDLLRVAQPKIAMAAPPGRALFDRADFGLWVNLGRTLAKAVRVFASDLDRRDRLSEAAEPAGELMTRFADKTIWQALDNAREIRNQRAHGGVVSLEQVNGRLGGLEALISRAEQALGDGFEGIYLAQADQGRYHKGIHTFMRAQRLLGPSDVFDEFELRTRDNVDSEHLVFVSRDLSISPVLDIIPLVRLVSKSASSQKPCYFFESHVAGDTFSYVSYHFKDQPQVKVVDHELAEMLGQLARVPS